MKITQTTPMLPAPPRRLRVAAYARVSSGNDAMLHSLSAQISYFSSFIQNHPGWQYIGAYADKALTGTKGNRPEFQRLLADCREGKIDRIITKSISRFARNTVTLLEAVRELKALGIGITFQEQNIDSLSGDGELMLTILASFAQEESKSVSDNCKWRIRNDFKQGSVRSLRFMYGYRIRKGVIKIHPEQAAVVRRIFTDYLDGVGVLSIANNLYEEKVSSLYGGEWTPKRVRDILRNEKYAGNALLQKSYCLDYLTKRKCHNHGELPMYYAENTHPAIIDDDTFHRVQDRLAANWKTANVKIPTTGRYPFSGKIVCGNCGKAYKRRTVNHKITWQCGTYLTRGKQYCSAKQVPESVLFELTTELLGLPVFDEAEFSRQIDHILIPGPNHVLYIFKGGREAEMCWGDRSRSGSWTDEMKEQARQNAGKRYPHD